LGSTQTAHPRDPVLAAWFGNTGQTESGENITPESSKKISAVLACVRVLSESVASLPLIVYRRLRGGGKIRDIEHPLYRILHDTPNPNQTAFEFREMMMQHVLLRGNAYAQIVSSGRNAVEQLVPLHPDRVRPFIAPDGQVAYSYTPISGPSRVFLQSEILHWMIFSSDGIKGESLITHAAETLGLTLAADKYAARYFRNDGTPGGILEHPKTIGKTKEDLERFKAGWQEAQSGGNQHKISILEEGMSFKELKTTNKDSQFLELRAFQVTDIARIFRVPPHLIMDLTKATFSNIEMQSLEFVIYTLMPWLVRIEQRIHKDLFTPRQLETHFAEFLVTGLLRGDSAARAEFYQKLFAVGAMSPNEIRRLENMNPIGAKGDNYFVPMNMMPLTENMSVVPQQGRRAGENPSEADQVAAILTATHLNGNKENGKHGELISEK